MLELIRSDAFSYAVKDLSIRDTFSNGLTAESPAKLQRGRLV